MLVRSLMAVRSLGSPRPAGRLQPDCRPQQISNAAALTTNIGEIADSVAADEDSSMAATVARAITAADSASTEKDLLETAQGGPSMMQVACAGSLLRVR